MYPGLGIIWALIFATPAGLLGFARGESQIASAVSNFVADLILLFIVDSVVFYTARPWQSFQGLIPLIFFNLLVVFIVAGITDAVIEGADATIVVAGVLLVAAGITWAAGDNSGFDAQKAAYGIVHVNEDAHGIPIASSTAQLAVISPDIATTEASSAMASGEAGQRNYSTFLSLGTPVLQLVDNKMEYVFQLAFDGSGAKQRLNGVEPGYIMVSATDTNPDTAIVERYAPEFPAASMKIFAGAGQSQEPARYAYTHGYTMPLDDPTLEINDQGVPYYTITEMEPKLGWTFYAPAGVILINAHTGDITHYNLNQVPDWVDRVYSQDVAAQIATWYGNYGTGGSHGAGSTHANKFQVGTDEEGQQAILVYTGQQHPEWRMLLTSYNSDIAVSRIVEMNSATGVMNVYDPTGPMKSESAAEADFQAPSGQGTTGLRANTFIPVNLTLHMLLGHLTWMATYESGSCATDSDGTRTCTAAANPTFGGIGFLDAYNAQASNVTFGNTLDAALQNYQTQLGTEGQTSNTPGAGGQYKTVTGTISKITTDTSGGQEYRYLQITGDPDVYYGTEANLGPAILWAAPGQKVIMQVFLVAVHGVDQIYSFTDPQALAPH